MKLRQEPPWPEHFPEINEKKRIPVSLGDAFVYAHTGKDKAPDLVVDETEGLCPRTSIVLPHRTKWILQSLNQYKATSQDQTTASEAGCSGQHGWPYWHTHTSSSPSTLSLPSPPTRNFSDIARAREKTFNNEPVMNK